VPRACEARGGTLGSRLDHERRSPTAERLIVVSLRLPLTIRRSGGTWQAHPSSGGLVAALGPLAEQLDAHWIGWDGDAGGSEEPGRREVLATWEREHGFVPVHLPPETVEGFYDRYSNATLWPLLHGFPARIDLDRGSWRSYREANERFAGAIGARARPGDLIWIHDYQLALVPGLVRERLPDAVIGFFLHVPFPSAEIFRILPDRESMLRGMLGADLIGFQTDSHLHEFRRAVLEVLALGNRMDEVAIDGRSTALAAIPVGIVVEAWETLLEQRDVRERIERRRAGAGDLRTILAVDRLDDTKGIPERLRAFRELLRRRREWHGRAQLLQVAVPSR